MTRPPIEDIDRKHGEATPREFMPLEGTEHVDAYDNRRKAATMVKRYDEVKRYAQGETRSYVLASDFDRMRKRLVLQKVKRRWLSVRESETDKMRCYRTAAWYLRHIGAIVRGEPLEYFRKLGSD